MHEKRSHHRHNIPAAREMRGRETSPEEIIWEALRGRRLNGLEFRRQHPIGPFVVDFCCVERRLVVEIDGGIHAEQLMEDAQREVLITTAGYRILRFSNDDVLGRLSEVLTQILGSAQDEPPVRPAAPGRYPGWS